MWTPLAVLVAGAVSVLALWAGWRALRDRPVVLRQLLAGAVVEALLLVQALVAGIWSLRGSPPADVPTFWGYLLTSAIILPAAAAWAFAERTRWSSVVLLVGGLTVAFLQYRMVQVWSGT